MKTFKTLMSLMVLMAAFSCSKSPAGSEGYITFALDADEVVADVATRSPLTDYTTIPSASDFTLEITDASKAVVWSGMLSAWDPTSQWNAGEYTVKATYGSLEDEGFGKPYFEGVQKFTVKKGETTDVAVNVALGSTIIKIDCTPAFKAYYTDYSFKLERGGAEIAAFAKDETRGAFIDGYRITLTGSVKNDAGKIQTFSLPDFTALNPNTAYTVMIDVSSVGSSALSVTFDHNVADAPLYDVELND